jgi:DNA invertase Pin-like site-specific DNA recombinase
MNLTPVYLYDLSIKSEQQNPLTFHEEHEIIDYCNKNDLQIIKKVSDTLETFTDISYQRNLTDLILSDLPYGPSIICYSTSRLTRETKNFLFIKKCITEKFGKLIILEIPVDLNEMNGNCLYEMMVTVDTYRWQRKYNR